MTIPNSKRLSRAISPPSREGDLPAIQARVVGRVQGVGFRYFTVREATRLKLTGWVRNARDGSVEVYAEGDAAAIESFEETLRRGPPYANVHSVDVAHPVETGVYRSFRVEY